MLIKEKSKSKHELNKAIIKKANSLVLCGDYDGAQTLYEQVDKKDEKGKFMALVHQAEMYMRLG